MYSDKDLYQIGIRALMSNNIKEIYNALQNYLKDQPLPDWADKEMKEAMALGITDGTNPMIFIPRYQAAIMAKRAAKKK